MPTIKHSNIIPNSKFVYHPTPFALIFTEVRLDFDNNWTSHNLIGI